MGDAEYVFYEELDMDKKIIDNIVWWIPIKKLRNNIRELLLYFVELYTYIKNDVDNVNNILEIKFSNKFPIYFKDIYKISNYHIPSVCTSQICNQEFFGLPLFQYWYFYIEYAKGNKNISDIPLHRKWWEWIYIIHALYENNCLQEGKKGLGFGVGTEFLTALFASMGCNILATDLDANDERANHWFLYDENARNNMKLLNKDKICDDEIFNKNVSFMPLDMNNIPDDLNDFDFNWSACALEHIGGLENSIDFLINNLKTLKSGGIAVHTTEFNLSSNDDTILEPNLVLFREKDIINAIDKIEKLGHYVYPLNLNKGTYIADNYIDVPPYYRNNAHLKLKVGDYITTSIGIIIKKK